MSAVQSLIERGADLKPKYGLYGNYYFPLHHAIVKVRKAESKSRHFEMTNPFWQASMVLVY